MKKGVTLIEVIVVVAIFIIILLIYSPLESLKISNDLLVSVNAVVTSLKRAQVKSLSNENDSSWGIRVGDRKVTIFMGNNFANRNKSFDETFFIPANISVSGNSEMYFSKFTGQPSSTGTINISFREKYTKIIRINDQGVIEVQ